MEIQVEVHPLESMPPTSSAYGVSNALTRADLRSCVMVPLRLSGKRPVRGTSTAATNDKKRCSGLSKDKNNGLIRRAATLTVGVTVGLHSDYRASMIVTKWRVNI